MPTPFYVDSSMLRAWYTCTFKWWLRYGMHLTTKLERAELLSGRAAHEALALHLSGRTAAQSLRQFDATYKDWALKNVPTDERLNWANLRTILAQWMIDNPLPKLPYQPSAGWIEQAFEVPLDEHGDIMLTGCVDALADFQGRTVIVEHKTTGSLTDYWAGQWKMDSQLSAYCYAASHVFGLQVDEVLINGIEFKLLPSDPSKKCKTHSVPYAECGALHVKAQVLGPFIRPPQMIEDWKADALDAARKMQKLLKDAPDIGSAQSLAQEGKFNGSCRFCEFQEMCLAGRQPDLLKANLQYAPWDPRDVSHAITK